MAAFNLNAQELGPNERMGDGGNGVLFVGRKEK
jgi:hypothetical protein